MHYIPEIDRIEVVDSTMVEVYRQKTTVERIAVICDANETMRLLIAGRLRTDHPEWSDQQVSQEVARRMLGETERSAVKSD